MVHHLHVDKFILRRARDDLCEDQENPGGLEVIVGIEFMMTLPYRK